MRLRIRTGRGLRSVAAHARRAGAAAAAMLLAVPAVAQSGAGQTAPGTIVANTADVAWTIAGTRRLARSTTDRLIVAERLDVRLVAAPGPTDRAVAADLANIGNGTEAFAVVATPATDPTRLMTVVIDTDRDGACDLAVDRALVDGRTPALAAGAAVRLLACGAEGATRITARAVTGSGLPGTAFAGSGDGGGDAVVGPTGAAATLVAGDGTAAVGDAPVLVKSQAARAPDGSARAAAGGTITYTLAARFPAAVAAAEIEDAVPVGARLVPGSLRLDDAPFPQGEDPGAGLVRVPLGDVPAGAAHTVTFTVTVNP